MKNIHSFILFLSCVLTSVSAFAQIPEGYYSAIDNKSAAELKHALKACISQHKVYSYSELWDAYEVTDVVWGTKNQAREMYSSDVIYYPTRATLLNREHTVPKSWWGSSDSIHAYTDLFNVLPAEAKANGQKSNWPLGEINETILFDNGVSRLGRNIDSLRGDTIKVFEPADRYKGDFARIYFYVATCYGDTIWKNDAYGMCNDTNTTLKPWIIPTLLKWNEQDPVDEDELRRNEAVFYMQKNRNPFVDYPTLAHFIWGDSTLNKFSLAKHTPSTPKQEYTFKYKANRPVFSVTYGSDKEHATEVSKGTVLALRSGNSGRGVSLFTRINSGQWKETKGYNVGNIPFVATDSILIDGSICVEAFCTHEYRDAPSDTITAYFAIMDDSGYLLRENFSSAGSGDNTSTSNSSTKWAGNDNFTSPDNSAYMAGGAIKLGTGTKPGSITSKALSFNGGSLSVELDVKGWTKVEGKLQVSVADSTQEKSYTATLSDNFEHLCFTFQNVSANPIVTIATSAKRAFIDNITIYENATSRILPIGIKETSSHAHNLMGQKVSALYKGVIIKQGKKILKR